MTGSEVEKLLAAYLARKRFEAKIMLAMVGEALGKNKDNGTVSLGSLAAMGFGMRGVD